jgi:hypothetical protein
VGAAVLLGLWALAPETAPVWRANDSSIHAALVRWVTRRLTGGHLPLDGWFPYLSLGAARFHHYQSLPHLLTGSIGTVVGPDRAVAWSLYLLLATWPVSVYAGGRLLGLGRPVAGAAAAVAPLVASSQQMGVQWLTYASTGFGAWAQLWGIWALPVVMGFTWQAIAHRRHRGWAAASLALLVSIHLVVAYVAALLLGVWVLVGPERGRRRGRAALVGGAALAAAAWFVVPLVTERAWVTRNLLAEPIGYESVGFATMLRAFLAGNTLDAGRAALLTSLALGGIVIALTRVRGDQVMRALLASLTLGAVLYSGRASFPWLGALPGMGEIFMPRFIVALQVPCLYLAGLAVVAIIRWAMGEARGRVRTVSGALAVCAMVVAMSPAITQRVRFAEMERDVVGEQQRAEVDDRRDMRELLAIASARGPGRIYGGMNRLQVDAFTLGRVPFYMAFLGEDADGIGFTRPTWSILSDIESGFDDGDARQFAVFGVRYVIAPPGVRPRVPAARIASRGCCDLWQVGDVGYLRFATATRTEQVDRLTLLDAARRWFSSEDFDRNLVWTLDYAGPGAPEPVATPIGAAAPEPLGVVLEQTVDLADGRVDASVEVRSQSLLVLSATFDPGWRVTVDDAPARLQMVTPGVVAVPLEPGRHDVRFRWKGFPSYWLLALGWLAPLVLSKRHWRVFASPGEAT